MAGKKRKGKIIAEEEREREERRRERERERREEKRREERETTSSLTLQLGSHMALTKATDSTVQDRTVSVLPSLNRRVMDAS